MLWRSWHGRIARGGTLVRELRRGVEHRAESVCGGQRGLVTLLAARQTRTGGEGDDFTLTTAMALSPSTPGARAGRRTPSPATVDSLSPTLSLKLHQQQASRAAQTRVRSA